MSGDLNYFTYVKDPENQLELKKNYLENLPLYPSNPPNPLINSPY